MAVLGPESRLPFISCFDSKTVVGILEVDLTKVLGASNSVHNLSNQW